MEKRILDWIDSNQSVLTELSLEIHNHPELSGREHRSAGLHVDLLKKNGFRVEQPFLGLDTAFRAVYDSNRPGPCVAYLAEYDALPEIGHGCGHNLLGAVSTVAGIALSKVIQQAGGRVMVLGCPAEETNGAKVQMAEEGVFDHIDVAMLAHPYHCFQDSGSSAALQALRYEFFGKETHAADAPETGVNALEGVLALFGYVHRIKSTLQPGTTINGIISNGGTVANIIPGYASAEFHLRGPSGSVLEKLARDLEAEARRIALELGAQIKISNYEPSYKNMVTNQSLSKVFHECLSAAGQNEIAPPQNNPFSLDMGNVSQVCPAIHPYFGICQGSRAELHTAEFCACAGEEYAHRQALITVKALALTGLRVLTDQEQLAGIKEEFYHYKLSKA